MMVIKFKKYIIVFMISIVIFFTFSIFVFNMDSIDVLSEHKGIELPVVMYHQLTKCESRAGKYVLLLDQFERDLKFLKNNGYETVTVNEIIGFVNGKCDLPEKSIMITFDDGCETLYSYALPLLEKYGFNAVGFAVGSLADTYTELDDHNLNYSCLDWNEIKEMCEGGTVDIQSHSYDLHKNTAERSGAKKKKDESFEEYSEFLTDDVSKMKERMIKHTGKAPVAFAYPFGSYSAESAEILKKCGIEMVFTCEERVNIIKKSEPDCLFRLGRYNRSDGISSESFFEKMGIG